MAHYQQPASMVALTDQLERVCNTLKEYREGRDILMNRLKATDLSIEETLNENENENEQLLRKVEAEHARFRATELAGKQRSHIDGLPNEVLMGIFKIVCEETSDFHTGDMAQGRYMRPRKTPMDISQVCSRWRTVSLEQSELWREFGAHVDEGMHYINADRRIMTFRQYLHRSKDLPMDLWFASTLLNLETKGTVLHDALSYPHRVRRLAIFFDAGNQNADRMVEHILKSVWPYLESLEIDVSYRAEKFILTTTGFNNGKGFPQLTQLRSNADLFKQIGQSNLSRLTTIQIERCFRANFTNYPWSFLSDLVRTSTLLELCIGEDLFAPPELASGTPAVAKNLECFRCGDANVARWMWVDISFPKLQLLVLQGIRLGTLQFPYSVEEYRAHHRVQPPLAPNLHTLVLFGCTPAFGPPSMRFLGYATAPIAHLVIVDHGDVQEGNLFDSIVSNPHITYWSNLETITYKGEYDQGDTPHAGDPNDLLGFLEAQDTEKPLKLRLYLDEFEDWENWQELEDSGRFEDINWDEDVIPWPRRNFFSNQSQSALDCLT